MGKGQILSFGHSDGSVCFLHVLGKQPAYVERHYWPFFDTFNVNRDGLVIVFSPRAYLPHAFGHHEVTIPWSELRGRINEEFFTSNAARRLGLAPEAVAPAA
jgi:hypothetical protein